ncbi:MAG TPA: hypothetical protein VHW01_21380 [Polyangiaceae bacterium]|jgi:hypothetical protein|nr:hypothetical protein [Polyangiaceae bacterium]
MPRRLLIVRSTTQSQIFYRIRTTVRPRLHVIDLQKTPRRTSPPVLSDKRAAAVVANVNLARSFGGHMTRAFHCLRRTGRSRDHADPATLNVSRLPSDPEATLPQLGPIGLQRAFHQRQDLAPRLPMADQRPHLFEQIAKFRISREVHSKAIRRQRFDPLSRRPDRIRSAGFLRRVCLI